MMGPEIVLEEMETPPRDKTKKADDVGNIKTASISGVSQSPKFSPSPYKVSKARNAG